MGHFVKPKATRECPNSTVGPPLGAAWPGQAPALHPILEHHRYAGGSRRLGWGSGSLGLEEIRMCPLRLVLSTRGPGRRQKRNGTSTLFAALEVATGCWRECPVLTYLFAALFVVQFLIL